MAKEFNAFYQFLLYTFEIIIQYSFAKATKSREKTDAGSKFEWNRASRGLQFFESPYCTSFSHHHAMKNRWTFRHRDYYRF